MPATRFFTKLPVVSVPNVIASATGETVIVISPKSVIVALPATAPSIVITGLLTVTDKLSPGSSYVIVTPVCVPAASAAAVASTARSAKFGMTVSEIITLPLPSTECVPDVTSPNNDKSILAAHAVAVSALPVTLPVTLPVNTASAALVSNTTDEVLVLTTLPVRLPAISPVSEPINSLAVNVVVFQAAPSHNSGDQVSSVSFQTNLALSAVPRSISIPEVPAVTPAATSSLFNLIVLSVTSKSVVFTVVVVPLTIKSLVTVKLPGTTIEVGKLNVTLAVSEPLPATSISFAVPLMTET